MALSGVLASLLPSTIPQAPLSMPAPAGDYNLHQSSDDVLSNALGLLQSLQQQRTGGSPSSPVTLGGTSRQVPMGTVTPKQDSWFRTALARVGLDPKWIKPLENQGFIESGMNPGSPMHNTLVGLMQQDTGQYGSMWKTFPGLRPKGESLQQAYHDPVYAVETAAKYILGKLPGYGGYAGPGHGLGSTQNPLYNFKHRSTRGY